MESVEEVVVEGGRWENIKKGCCETCSSWRGRENSSKGKFQWYNGCWEDYEMREKGRKIVTVRSVIVGGSKGVCCGCGTVCLASTCQEKDVV